MMNIENKSWFIDINKVKTDYVVIEDLEQFKSPKVPYLHPEHPKYKTFWAREIKKCIEGIWGVEFGKYRFMPPKLYFFGNYGVIEDTDHDTKLTTYRKPSIVDFIWDYAYMSIVSYGFSGFSKDKKISCHKSLKDYLEGNIKLKYVHESCFKEDGSLKQYEEPFQYVSRLHNEILGKPEYFNQTSNTVVLGSRGGGKSLSINELCRVEDGWKRMGDLEVGDKIYGSDGKLATITWKSIPEKMPYYRITLRDGRTIEACKDHSWKVWDKNKNRKKKGQVREDNFTVMSTKDMFDKYYYEKVDSKHKKKYNEIKYCKEYILALPTCKPIESKEKELPIDPYLLGLILGDGSITQGVSITSGDSPVLDFIKKQCEKNNWTYRIKEYSNKNCSTLFITNKNKVAKSIKSLLQDLNLIGTNSHTKFIPDVYKYGSIEQRFELLRGLMDTDGFVDQRHIEYSTASKQLSKDFQDLVRSLGINCKTTEREASYRDQFGNRVECSISYKTALYTEEKIFNLERKQDFIDNHEKSKAGKSKYNKTFIVNIEPIEDKLGQCISVDNEDHTYITKDYIVTHNSYWSGIGELEHNYVFRGARRYEDFARAKSDQCVGSGDTEKSSELLDKFFESQMAKTNSEVKEYVEWFGTYVENKGSGSVVHPCPLYVRSSGSLAPSNKKNKYRNKYKKKVDGTYQLVGGTGSSIAHVNFSPQKGGKGDTAAAGGRYVYVNVEEVGLLPNYISVMGSNEGTISRRGVRFGVQACQGTSGSLEDVQAVKKVFLDPRSYNMIAFPNKWTNEGTNGEIGYFLPNYITLFQFKDKNGNTDFEAAIDSVNQTRLELSKSKDPRVLRDFLMNKPCLTHEMWYTDKGYYLPSQEASERNRELMNNNLYKELGTPVELYWKEDNTVDYNIVHDREPHYDFPIPKDIKDPSGCVVIYEQPEPDPYGDMYCFIGHDPYIAEELDKGGSLGVTYILKNPKYLSNGRTGNIIVASYIGKPIKGLNYYYDQQEKLIAMYGNNVNSLWYEYNRGEICRAYYLKKNKFDILATTPQYFQGNSIFEKKDTRTGFYVGANGSLSKKNLLKTLADWLLEETEIKGEVKKNLFRIPCKFLIDQIEKFNIDDNFDAVSAMIGCVLGLREYELRFSEEVKEEHNRVKNFFGKSLDNLIF